MKTVYEVKDFITTIAQDAGFSPKFFIKKMHKLKYTNSHITIRIGDQLKSFNSKLKIRRFVIKNISKFEKIHPMYQIVEIEGPLNDTEYDTLFKNKEEGKKKFPTLNTTIYNRLAPNGSLKYRVKLTNYMRSNSDDVERSIETLVNCFGEDITQDIYVKYNKFYPYSYSKQHVYINFASEDDIIMISPFLNDSCWQAKKLEIYEG